MYKAASRIRLQSSKAAKGEQKQGSRGDQQGHRAVVAFHPKGRDVLVEKRTDLPVLTIRGVTAKSFIN